MPESEDSSCSKSKLAPALAIKLFPLASHFSVNRPIDSNGLSDGVAGDPPVRPPVNNESAEEAKLATFSVIDSLGLTGGGGAPPALLANPPGPLLGLPKPLGLGIPMGGVDGMVVVVAVF